MTEKSIGRKERTIDLRGEDREHYTQELKGEVLFSFI
jgi:hypothetical protein